MTEKFKIVTQARTWLGTPFKHQGRLKGIGVDCLGLIIGVLAELEINISGKNISQLDEQNYSMLPSGERLQNKLNQYLQKIEINQISAGDILLMQFTREPQHLAFVTNHPNGFGVIHAYLQAGKVVEHSLDDVWQNRIVAAYRI
jgi:NlpC/P60 family putative phage cell wall peptidase